MSTSDTSPYSSLYTSTVILILKICWIFWGSMFNIKEYEWNGEGLVIPDICRYCTKIVPVEKMTNTGMGLVLLLCREVSTHWQGSAAIDWLLLLAEHCRRIILSLPFSCDQQRLLSFSTTAAAGGQAEKTLQKQFVGIFKLLRTIGWVGFSSTRQYYCKNLHQRCM